MYNRPRHKNRVFGPMLVLFSCLLALLPGIAGAEPQQNVTYAWTETIGSVSNDLGQAIAIDSDDNIYVTGFFEGMVDFDLGAGTVEFLSDGAEDVFIAKYDKNRTLVWGQSIGGSGSDQGLDIAVDNDGNVYVTGSFQGVADFDSSPLTYELTSAGETDIFVVKLDIMGNLVWAKGMGGTGADLASGISVDNVGNVYTVGDFRNMADFDPGANTFVRTSAGEDDFFVSKLDSAGNYIWAKSIGAGNSDSAKAVSLDAFGNVYVTGLFRGTVDFDPGAETVNLSTIDESASDTFVLKLDADGSYVWAKHFNSTTSTFGDAVRAGAIEVDDAGNVYSTGWFKNTADFDPGPGTFNLTSEAYDGQPMAIDPYNIYVSKLDSNGDFVWAQKGESRFVNRAEGITFDIAGNVYITGRFQYPYYLSPDSQVPTIQNHFHIAKLDKNGTHVWHEDIFISDPNVGRGVDITLDSAGSVYSIGYFAGTCFNCSGTSSDDINSAGETDILINKLTQPTADATVPDGDVQALINAIHAANAASTQATARQSASPAVVNLAINGNYTLTAPENSFGGGNGLPVITGTVVISGNGATIARSSAPGIPDFRILANSGTLTLDNVIVSNGFLQESVSPGQIGGAILNTGVLSITNSTVQSSTNRFGGGVGNRGGTLYIADSLIQNNGPTGENGGGVFNSNEGRLTIERSEIRNNQASNDGGGVANQQEGLFILMDTLVTNNRALNGDGGGVYNRSLAPSVVISSTISQNSADSTNSSGGGIANHASDRDSALTIQYSHILSNTSDGIGGGIASLVHTDLKADLVVSHSEIAGNRAVGSPDLPGTGLGGGVVNLNFLGAGNSTGLMTITHSTIRHNEAVNGGGVGNALAGAIGPVLIRTAVDSSAIYSNTATGTGDQRGNGGGIANVDATLDMINSTLSNNRAVSDGPSQTSGLGGGIFNASPGGSTQLTLRNSTLAENRAVAGGGLTNVKLSANASATVTFQNSIVSNNTDLSGLGPNCLNPNLGAGAATLASNGHNLDSGATCGFSQTGDLSNTAPMLAPLADNGGFTWTHALMNNSPAIDAANSDACPATDQRGVARPVGNGCDIGAYEGGTRTAENRIYLPLTQR